MSRFTYRVRGVCLHVVNRTLSPPQVEFSIIFVLTCCCGRGSIFIAAASADNFDTYRLAAQ